VVDGIDPLSAGLEVSDKVDKEAGREFGGEAKLLFVMYLLISRRLLRWEKETYRVPRDMSWMRDGTGPSRLLNDKSLVSALTPSQVRVNSHISQARRESIEISPFQSLSSDNPEHQLVHDKRGSAHRVVKARLELKSGILGPSC